MTSKTYDRRLGGLGLGALWVGLSVLCLAGISLAQDAAEVQPPTTDTTAIASETRWLDEVVVTATGSQTRAFAAPYSTSTVQLNNFLQNKQYRTTTQALSNLEGVMVQKTGNAQGSPYIRGFTGFRTLMLLDGIRLNNSVFRDGPNQYWNLVDPYTIDRLELVRGPSSVLYGSDAIGGTVNAVLRRPDGYGDGVNAYGQTWSRVSSAERSITGRPEVIATYDETVGLLLGGTYSDYGALRAGGSYGLQKNTGYSVPAGDLRVEWWLDPNTCLTFGNYMLAQDDAWRTHKTIYGKSWHGTTVGDELKRSLDQYHQLTYARLEKENIGGLVDALSLTFSYQRLKEDQDRMKADRTSDRQGFAVNTFGMDGKFVSPTAIGTITSGFEWYHDSVSSYGKKYNVDGSWASTSIQGPVGDDARYNLMGLYLQDEIPVTERVTVTLGGRYTYADAYAGKVQDPTTGNQTSMSGDWDQLTGSARISWMLDQEEHWNLYGGVSQGFRAPNLSDLSRLDSARSDEIETAAPGLDPENYTAYEIGLKTQYENFNASACYYYTDIDDMIIRVPTGRTIDGDQEVTKQNAGQGYVQGVELASSYRFHPQWTAFGRFTWEYGETSTYPTSDPTMRDEALSRLMPPTGQLGLRWDHPTERIWVEATCTAAGDADKLSTRDKGDTQRIPPGGTPGYVKFDIYSGWQVTDDLEVWGSVENLTNESYRTHGSGINEPGLNVILGLRWRF